MIFLTTFRAVVIQASTFQFPWTEVVVGALGWLGGVFMGAIGGAWGATMAMRTRMTRVEMRIGITDRGRLTGDGLIKLTAGHTQEIEYLKERL